MAKFTIRKRPTEKVYIKKRRFKIRNKTMHILNFLLILGIYVLLAKTNKWF